MMKDNIRFSEKPPWPQLDRDPEEADRQRLLYVAMRGTKVRMTTVDTWEMKLLEQGGGQELGRKTDQV